MYFPQRSTPPKTTATSAAPSKFHSRARTDEEAAPPVGTAVAVGVRAEVAVLTVARVVVATVDEAIADVEVTDTVEGRRDLDVLLLTMEETVVLLRTVGRWSTRRTVWVRVTIAPVEVVDCAVVRVVALLAARAVAVQEERRIVMIVDVCVCVGVWKVFLG